jgi:hypothetical protein
VVDIASFAIHGYNCITDPSYNIPIASATMASNVVSFIYHKVPCDPKTDLFLQVMDNYMIAVRIHVNVDELYGEKFQTFRRMGLLYSTIMVFCDYENYSANNHCIGPFITVIPNIITSPTIGSDLGVYLKYGHGFAWYMLERGFDGNPDYDIGRLLRDGRWISNHEIFHFLNTYADMVMIRAVM